MSVFEDGLLVLLSNPLIVDFGFSLSFQACQYLEVQIILTSVSPHFHSYLVLCLDGCSL